MINSSGLEARISHCVTHVCQCCQGGDSLREWTDAPSCELSKRPQPTRPSSTASAWTSSTSSNFCRTCRLHRHHFRVGINRRIKYSSRATAKERQVTSSATYSSVKARTSTDHNCAAVRNWPCVTAPTHRFIRAQRQQQSCCELTIDRRRSSRQRHSMNQKRDGLDNATSLLTTTAPLSSGREADVQGIATAPLDAPVSLTILSITASHRLHQRACTADDLHTSSRSYACVFTLHVHIARHAGSTAATGAVQHQHRAARATSSLFQTSRLTIGHPA